MDSAATRTLPLFIDWMYPKIEKKSESINCCDVITKIFQSVLEASLVSLEILGLLAVNYVTFSLISLSSAVYSEEDLLFDYIRNLFSDSTLSNKTVTIIPTNSTSETQKTEDKDNIDSDTKSFSPIVSLSDSDSDSDSDPSKGEIKEKTSDSIATLNEDNSASNTTINQNKTDKSTQSPLKTNKQKKFKLPFSTLGNKNSINPRKKDPEACTGTSSNLNKKLTIKQEEKKDKTPFTDKTSSSLDKKSPIKQEVKEKNQFIKKKADNYYTKKSNINGLNPKQANTPLKPYPQYAAKTAISSTSTTSTTSTTTSVSVTKTANKVHAKSNPVTKAPTDNKPVTLSQPGQKPKSFNDLSPKEIALRVKTINSCMTRMSRTDKTDLIEFKTLFINDVKKAEVKALQLHQTFLEKFTKPNDSIEEAPPAFYEGAITCSSIFQFKEAVKIAKEQFPGLTTLAYTPELKLKIAKIIQIIMCGKAAQTDEVRKICCFQFRELLDSTYSEINAFEDKPEGNYLVDLLKEDNESLTPTQAFLDAFDELCDDHFNLTQLLSNIKMNIFCSISKFSSENIAEYVATYRNSPLLAAIGTKNEHNPDALPDVQKILEQAISQAKRSIEHRASKRDEKSDINIFKQKLKSLNDFLTFVKLDLTDKGLVELSKSSNCTKDELRSLIQILILEFIILSTSRSTAFTKNALADTFKEYSGPAQLNSKTSSSTCAFTLDNIEIQTSNQLSIGIESYFAEGVQEHFNETIVIAEVTSSEKLKNLHQPENEPSRMVTPLSRLIVSWQTPPQILDYLAFQIDPTSVDKQPARRFQTYREEMKVVDAKLKTLEAVESTQPSPIWGWFTGTKNVAKTLELSEQIEPINAIIISASNTYNQFIRAAKLSNQLEKEVMPTVINFTGALEAAKITITKLQNHAASYNKIAESEALHLILDDINTLQVQLPKSEINQVVNSANFFQRTFAQSNNAKEISWKILRYEAQLRCLKENFDEHFTDLEKKDENDLTMTQLLESRLFLPGDDEKLIAPAKRGMLIALYRQLETLTGKVKISKELGEESHFTQAHLEILRKGYEKFLKNLRQSLTRAIAKKSVEDLQDLEMICMILFTKIDLSEVMEYSLDLFNEIGANALGQNPAEDDPTAGQKIGHEKKLDPHVQHIHTLQKRIKAVPYTAMAPLPNQLANSLRGQFNRDFDPAMQSNPIQHLHDLTISKYGEEKVVKIIAMGTPTSEDKYSNIALTPEFKGFGRWCKSNGKKWLYVNNQNFKPTGKSWTSPSDWLSYVINGEETNRCMTIMNAQSDPELEGAFFAITLAKNSTFYRQEGEFSNANKAAQFKKTLVDQVFTNDFEMAKKTGCYIPPELLELYKKATEKDFKDQGALISSMIHDELFGSRDDLTLEERKIFIELFYSHIIKEVVIYCDFDFLSRICKDDIDRGLGSNAEAFAEDSLIASKGAPTGYEKKKLEAVLLIRAPLVRKRAMLDEREERFCEGYQFRIENLKGLICLHKNLFPGITIVPS
ncbi:MAG: hypothetical protein H0T62_07710 [Parachlamydiaceae bacterium]|nr:hypothetical protein [Parachlamydiaceae bacterium]